MYKHILIAVDGSEIAEHAAEHGLKLAKRVGAKCTAMMALRPWHTVAPGEIMVAFPEAEYLKGAAAYAEKSLKRIGALASEQEVECETSVVSDKEPWQAIVESAKALGCDLIVMGSHGRSGLTKLILGSEAQKVLTHATVPILIDRS